MSLLSVLLCLQKANKTSNDKEDHMMSRKKEMTLIAAGMLAGALLVPTAHAAVRQLTATPAPSGSMWTALLFNWRLTPSTAATM